MLKQLKFMQMFVQKNKREALENAYENITDTCYPDWNDDKTLMTWLNELSSIKK